MTRGYAQTFRKSPLDFAENVPRTIEPARYVASPFVPARPRANIASLRIRNAKWGVDKWGTKDRERCASKGAHTHTTGWWGGRYIPIPRWFFSGKRAVNQRSLRFHIPFGSLSLQGRVKRRRSVFLRFAGFVVCSFVDKICMGLTCGLDERRFCLQICDRNRRSLLCQLGTGRIALLTVGIPRPLYASSLIRPLANVFVQWTKGIAVIIFESFVAASSSCPISSPLSFKWGDMYAYAKTRPHHYTRCMCRRFGCGLERNYRAWQIFDDFLAMTLFYVTDGWSSIHFLMIFLFGERRSSEADEVSKSDVLFFPISVEMTSWHGPKFPVKRVQKLHVEIDVISALVSSKCFLLLFESEWEENIEERDIGCVHATPIVIILSHTKLKVSFARLIQASVMYSINVLQFTHAPK